MRQLWEVADFIRGVRRQMRFGELSRAPLQILRLEWRGNAVECDWMVRPADVWDAELRRPDRERNVSQQALQDAMALRDLIFAELTGVECASLRAFRPSAPREPLELIIAGTVLREEIVRTGIRSLAMKVKLCGLKFSLDNGVLRALQEQECGIFKVVDDVHFNHMTL